MSDNDSPSDYIDRLIKWPTENAGTKMKNMMVTILRVCARTFYEKRSATFPS